MKGALYNGRRVLAFQLANLVLGGLPRQVSYALMAVVGWVVATIFPSRVAGLRSNLEHVFPDYTPAQVTDLMQRNAKNYGKFWVDLFKMPRLPLDYKKSLASVDGWDNLQAVMDRGKGCIAMSIHMGGWEGCASYWGAASPWRTGLIAEVLRPAVLWRKVLKLRESSGMTVIPLSRTAPRDILRRLKNNEIVIGAIDRDLLGGGKPYPFFTGTISVPTGLLEVAQRTGAGVLPMICYRRPDDTSKFLGMTPIWVEPGRAGVEAAARTVLAHFEDCIRQYPDQWHVMVPIFHPPAAAVPLPARPGVPARVEVMASTAVEERVG
ncbi:MAG: lysophospholipid acyltransferase family protein [Candidatus Dormibacteria bacterium]